jgi:hypothetical protein
LKLILLLALVVGLGATSCYCSKGERTLEYMFDEDDPQAVVSVSFPLAEIYQRLDESGHQHGREVFDGPPSREVHVAMLDNSCQEAWFQQEIGQTRAIRIVGLEAADACDDGGTREELRRVFEDEFVQRLEGALPPLPYTGEGELYEYPAGSRPSLTLAGPVQEVRRRFDDAVGFAHEYHDGVFYLSPVACSGRFLVLDGGSGNSVRVEGIGYVKPCAWGEEQTCLNYWFAVVLGERDQVSPVPTQCAVNRRLIDGG